MSDAFPPPIDRLLACAANHCARQGGQLTPVRRSVLGLVIAAAAPIGAYDLLQRLAARQGATAPPTIYRALDFLRAHGLVHKIERLAAYVACTHHLRHDHAHPPHTQMLQFLICTTCGHATELEDPAIAAALHAAAAKARFRPGASTIEVAGVCGACAEDR